MGSNYAVFEGKPDPLSLSCGDHLFFLYFSLNLFLSHTHTNKHTHTHTHFPSHTCLYTWTHSLIGNLRPGMAVTPVSLSPFLLSSPLSLSFLPSPSLSFSVSLPFTLSTFTIFLPSLHSPSNSNP